MGIFSFSKKGPKYPRLVVSAERHMALSKEAKKRGMTLTELGEEKLSK